MRNRVLIAVAKDGSLRARAAELSDVVAEACSRHQPSRRGAAAFARALGVSAVFPVDWKNTERLSIQWAGNGPLGSVFVDHREAGGLRVMRKGADEDQAGGFDALRPGDLGLLPGGILTVSEQAPNGAYNQGQVALQTGDLDRDVESWFTQSQQTPTRIRARADFDAAGVPLFAMALLVQPLADGDPAALPSGAALDAADYSAGPQALLKVAFGERPFEVLEERPLSFACPCSRERVAAGISLIDGQELLSMIQEDHGAQTRCEFCAESYEFSADDLCSIYDLKLAATGER